MSLLQYIHAVSAAVRHRGQPLAHLLLRPIIPALKYVLPLGGTIMLIHFTGVDSMVSRILAEEDARLMLEAERHALKEGMEWKHGR
jgi:hypothetical protein